MKQKKHLNPWIVSFIILILFFTLSCPLQTPTHFLTVVHQGNGTTEPSGDIRVNTNEATPITALPGENGIFTEWKVLSGSSYELSDAYAEDTTITLSSGNVAVQANFIPAMEGSFAINDGNTNTLSESVTLYIDVSGATEMRFGNTPEELNAAAWEPYGTTREWVLTSDYEPKTVYGEFRDNDGHRYSVSDDILLIIKKTASDASVGDRFGHIVAISSDMSTIVVGAYCDDNNGSNSGSVYVYTGTNWDDETIILPSDGAAGDCFGNGVAVSSDGSTIVVGAYCDDDNGTDSGSVYVFDSTNWANETKINPVDAAGGDRFGVRVAISSDGSTIVAGAYYDSDNGTESGSVYVFHGTNWANVKKITPGDAAEGDRFGVRVDISSDGSTIVAGAHLNDDNGTDSGSAYVYTGTNWDDEIIIIPDDGAAGDYFGISVAISSDSSTIVIGADQDDDNGPESGSVYIYDGINWRNETKIIPDDGAENDYFGYKVAVSSDGSTIVAGALEDDDNGPESGSVYIYTGTNWETETKITPCDGAANDYFGYSVDVSPDGSTIVVGARDDENDGVQTGSAYIFVME